LSLFKILYQFSTPSLEMRGFNLSYQIFLSLSDISSVSHNSILNCLHRLTHFRSNVNSNIIIKYV